MNKKIMGLVLVGMMSLSVVGCGNEVKYQESQTQQEQVIDEDLTKGYQKEMQVKNELEQAKEIVEIAAEGNFKPGEYDIIVDEESNTVILRAFVTKSEIIMGLNDGSYYEVKLAMTEYSTSAKTVFESYGLNTNSATVLYEPSSDSIYLGIVNGVATYDCSQN